MLSHSYKSKQYLLVALKVLLLLVAGIFIYNKITTVETQTWEALNSVLTTNNSYTIIYLIIFVLMAVLNWLLEIYKWKIAVSKISRISLWQATKQSLAGLTAALATPARIGDYGIKAAYFKTENRKQIVLLNLFTNGSQMLITFFFGVIGCIYVWLNYAVPFSALNITIVIAILIIVSLILYSIRNHRLLIKGLTLNAVMRYFKKLPDFIKVGTLTLSLLRYLVFSSLFYLLLEFFGATTAALTALPFIFAMYFLVSIIPSYFVLDVVIRGGVAVYLFSLLNVPEPTVLATVLAMWVLNFLIPAILGSYFVLTFKLHKSV